MDLDSLDIGCVELMAYEERLICYFSPPKRQPLWVYVPLKGTRRGDILDGWAEGSLLGRQEGEEKAQDPRRLQELGKRRAEDMAGTLLTRVVFTPPTASLHLLRFQSQRKCKIG